MPSVNRVRELREQRGMTREDLASAVGVSLGTIRNVEAQTASPSVATALSIAKVLGVPVEELFAGSAA